MSLEQTFTEIYRSSLWGSKESRSGPTSTLDRTTKLREYLPTLFKTLEISSLFDAGCGDWNWMRSVNLSGIRYIGADIVTPLIETLQTTYTSSNVHFQKMDILAEPPETADLWLLRDVANLYTWSEIDTLIEKFLDSGSKFLAITNIEIETSEQPSDSETPSWRPVDFFKEPFAFPQPILRLDDGQQWFRKKELVVFSQGALEDWKASRLSISEVGQERIVHGKQGRNAHLVSNVSLRSVELRGHTV
jgi:hypothetical protein